MLSLVELSNHSQLDADKHQLQVFVLGFFTTLKLNLKTIIANLALKNKYDAFIYQL